MTVAENLCAGSRVPLAPGSEPGSRLNVSWEYGPAGRPGHWTLTFQDGETRVFDIVTGSLTSITVTQDKFHPAHSRAHIDARSRHHGRHHPVLEIPAVALAAGVGESIALLRRMLALLPASSHLS
jgi:hypothetical protein